MISFLMKRLERFFVHLGDVTILAGQSIRHSILRPHMGQVFDQMYRLGVKSLPITTVTALFIGMAFALQIVQEFLKFGAGKMIGGILALALWRELAPLLTAVVVAGRVGAAIAAELGTMKVTEQVEALEAMGQDPVRYLVAPRITACTLIMPLLVGWADVVGFLGGFVIAMSSGRVNPYMYFEAAQSMLHVSDITGGLMKGVFFGFCIALISAYMGLSAKSGAKGVGEVTTRAVVVSLIVIFILNYFLSTAFFT
jgi:phospholipid/cholesterol/gamma-HCH transport system permease protein